MTYRPEDVAALADGILADGGPAPDYRGAIGAISDFDVAVQIDGSFLCTWDLDINSGFDPGGWAIYIYKFGNFLERITDTSWTFDPDETDEDINRWHFDFLLLPNWEKNANYQWIQNLDYLNRVNVAWSYAASDNSIAKVEIFRNDLNSDSINLSTARKKFLRPTARISTTPDLTLGGKWRGEQRSQTVALVVSQGGAVGVAKIAWTVGEDSGEIVTSARSQLLVNGLSLTCDATAYTEGATYTINLEFPTKWTTGKLSSGEWLFQVATYSSGNHQVLSTEIPSILVVKVPGKPTLISTSYTDGTGTAVIRWAAPAGEPNLSRARVYRNWPTSKLSGMGGVHPVPFDDFSVSPGGVVEYTVDDLEPGLNKILLRVANDSAREENTDYAIVNLDASMNEMVSASEPFSVAAIMEDDFTVTATVIASDDSDTINLYHDSGTGTVDYTTVWATAPNPATSNLNTIAVSGLYLADGSYVIAARAQNSGVEETNTTVLTHKYLVVDSSVPPVAESISLALV